MDILFWAHFLNGFLMIAMPSALAIYLTRTWKLGWRLWFIGAATFIFSQVGHIPFLQLSTWLLNRAPFVNIFQNMSKPGLVIFNGIFLGLAAGLFEELFRYGMFRWAAKDARSWRAAIMTGAGHGGAEAIIIGVLAFLAFMQLVAYRYIDLSTVVSAEQLDLAKAQVAAYWSLPWYEAFLPSFERLAAMVIQISMAVLVLQNFVRKQWFWVWLAVIYHGLIDFFAVPFAAGYIDKYTTEAIAGGFALLSLSIIFALRRPEPESVVPQPIPVTAAAAVPVQPIEETNENLDASKYQ